MKNTNILLISVVALLVVIVILIARPQISLYIAEQELTSILEKKAQELELKNKECALKYPVLLVLPNSGYELTPSSDYFSERHEHKIEQANSDSEKSRYLLGLMMDYDTGFSRDEGFWDGTRCDTPKRVSTPTN